MSDPTVHSFSQLEDVSWFTSCKYVQALVYILVVNSKQDRCVNS